MFAVTIDAYGGIFCAGSYGVAVHAFVIDLGDFLVAHAASIGNLPAIYFRASLPGWMNIMISVAIITICSLFAARGNGAAVHAQLVGFHRMSHGNFVARKKAGVAVALRPSVRQLFVGYQRFWF